MIKLKRQSIKNLNKNSTLVKNNTPAIIIIIKNSSFTFSKIVIIISDWFEWHGSVGNKVTILFYQSYDIDY